MTYGHLLLGVDAHAVVEGGVPRDVDGVHVATAVEEEEDSLKIMHGRFTSLIRIHNPYCVTVNNNFDFKRGQFGIKKNCTI